MGAPGARDERAGGGERRVAVGPVAECEVDYRAGRGEHQERHNGQRVRGERVQHLPVRPEELLYTQDCEYVYGRGEATM